MNNYIDIIANLIHFFIFFKKIWKLVITYHTPANFCGGTLVCTNIKRIYRSWPTFTIDSFFHQQHFLSIWLCFRT